MGNLAALISAAGGKVRYTYDQAGRLTSKVDANVRRFPTHTTRRTIDSETVFRRQGGKLQV